MLLVLWQHAHFAPTLLCQQFNILLVSYRFLSEEAITERRQERHQRALDKQRKEQQRAEQKRRAEEAERLRQIREIERQKVLSRREQ